MSKHLKAIKQDKRMTCCMHSPWWWTFTVWCNAVLWQPNTVDNWLQPPLLRHTAHLFWPAVCPWTAITWQCAPLDSCPLSVSMSFARSYWMCPRIPRCPTRHRSMQNKQSNWEIKTVSLFVLSLLIPALGCLPPRGFITALTSNL